MHLVAITCLPSLSVDEGEMVCGAMRIAPLHFDHWLALEGQGNSAAYNKLEGKYRRNPPFFLYQPLAVDHTELPPVGPSQTQALLAAARPAIEVVAKALHLYLGTPPIHPLRSVTYFDMPASTDKATKAEFGVPRAYGESDKEYVILNRNPEIVLNVTEAPALIQMIDFVRRAQPIWEHPGSALAWSSLSRSSAPGLRWTSRVLMTVGAIEALVMPELKEGLTAAFERRVAVLAAADADEAERLRLWLRPAYRIRSDIVHGRPLARTLERLPIPPHAYLEWLGKVGITAISRLIGLRLTWAASQQENLGAFLDTAGPAAIEALIDANGDQPPHRWGAHAPC